MQSSLNQEISNLIVDASKTFNVFHRKLHCHYHDLSLLEKYADEFSNSRNLVAGIVNQKKVEADKFKDVDFVAYEVIKPTLKPSEQMDFLEKEAVDVVIHETLDDIDNTLLSNMLMNWRENYKYGIIGSD